MGDAKGKRSSSGTAIAIVGLAGLAAFAWYMSRKPSDGNGDGDVVPPGPEDWTCPPGFDCIIWAQAIASCPGCTYALTVTRYYAIMAEHQGDPLTEAEKAELARLWANVLAATTAIDKAYCQWLYWKTKSQYQPADTTAAANATSWLNEYNRLLQEQGDAEAALIAFYETKIASYQGQLTTLEGYLAGSVLAYQNAVAIVQQYIDNLNARLASTDRQATVCTETNAYGTCVGIPWGDWPDITAFGINNNSIESMAVYKGVKLTYFKDKNFGGTSAIADATLNSIPFFNLPSNWRNEIGSLTCRPSFSDYYRIRDSYIAAMNAAWGDVENRREQIRSLARDIDLWINMQELLNLHLASRQGLIDRIDAVLAYVESISP